MKKLKIKAAKNKFGVNGQDVVVKLCPALCSGVNG